MDVPVPGADGVIGDRAYGTDPATVAALALAAAEGLADAGVVSVIKHIPGHGRATSDSHKELPVVEADLATLRGSDFRAFKDFCARPEAPPAFAMTAHVVYTAIDRERPATTSPRVIADIIRGEIGFKGLLMSDDLGMKALTGPFDERAAASLAAGCDVVLHCDGELADMEAVAKGCGSMSARGLESIAATASFRRKARREIANAAAAEISVWNALRHG